MSTLRIIPIKYYTVENKKTFTSNFNENFHKNFIEVAKNDFKNPDIFDFNLLLVTTQFNNVSNSIDYTYYLLTEHNYDKEI